jgi:hypothetical protein
LKDRRSQDTPEAPLQTLGRVELLLTVFICGAAALTIEILGTRIVGPSFGVSLFVWSALLAVTLGALATGYYAGGVLIDRMPGPRLLGLVVIVSGVLLGLVRATSHVVLRAAESMGPRAGALLSAAVLFGPSLVALGMTGPIAVRLATSDLRAAGRNRVTEINVDQANKNVDNAPSKNDTRLIGVVREEPKTREVGDGRAMTVLSVATKAVVNGREREDWHSVTLWGKTAEAARDIKAGDTVAINGSLPTVSIPFAGLFSK